MGLQSIPDLKVFLQVVDSDSFAAAARVLGTPANTVSRTIARLELQLGATLFHRTTRQLRLSDGGRNFHVRALQLIAAVHDAEASVVQSEQALSGTLRILVRTTTVQLEIVRYLTQLLREHPELRLQLLVSDVEVDVIRAGLDLALVVGPQPDSTLIGRSLGSVTFVLAATPGYLDANGRPAQPRDLAAHECIRALVRRPQISWSLVGPRGRRVVAAVDGRFECSDVRAQAQAVYNGFGIGPRPLGEVETASREGTLERVLPKWKLEPIPVRVVQPPRPIGAARRAGVEAVIVLLEEAIHRLG